MEASSVRKIGGKSPRDLFSSRRGTSLIAIGAALVAGILILVFIQSYRNSVNTKATTTPVFVASGYIPRGASATLIASGQLLQRATVKSNAVRLRIPPYCTARWRRLTSIQASRSRRPISPWLAGRLHLT
jgi:hypothetical protein